MVTYSQSARNRKAAQNSTDKTINIDRTPHRTQKNCDVNLGDGSPKSLKKTKLTSPKSGPLGTYRCPLLKAAQRSLVPSSNPRFMLKRSLMALARQSFLIREKLHLLINVTQISNDGRIITQIIQ